MLDPATALAAVKRSAVPPQRMLKYPILKRLRGLLARTICNITHPRLSGGWRFVKLVEPRFAAHIVGKFTVFRSVQ